MSESPVERIPEWTLGDRLDKARKDADVSVEDMAAYLGYSTATMRNWTHDRAVPRDLVLRQWALRCGVSYNWLVNGEVTVPKATWEAAGSPRDEGRELARTA